MLSECSCCFTYVMSKVHIYVFCRNICCWEVTSITLPILLVRLSGKVYLLSLTVWLNSDRPTWECVTPPENSRLGSPCQPNKPAWESYISVILSQRRRGEDKEKKTLFVCFANLFFILFTCIHIKI